MSILRSLIPDPDACRTEFRVVNATPSTVYTAALNTDFLDSVRESFVVRSLFALRSVAERAVAALRRRKFEEPPTPPALFLKDLRSSGEWVRLGESPPWEFAFGVVGRFWGGETRWQTIDAESFAQFNEPGYARIGCHLLMMSGGEQGTLLMYETRVKATDEASRRAFMRYWRVVSPFVGFIMRVTLAVIGRNAQAVLATTSQATSRRPQETAASLPS